MPPEQKMRKITWDTLNLCIGSIFEIMQNKRDFSTADVARHLGLHGVEVTNWPAEFLSQGQSHDKPIS